MSEHLDSRELEDRLNELEDEEERTEEEEQELKALKELKDDTGNYGWEHGIDFIPEYDFESYAEDLFDECYAHDIPESLRSYIDYKSFARDLEMDYTSVTYEGTDYLFREA